MMPLFCYLLAFFLGSVPTAYLVVKKVKGIDIRRHGSGNVGATNAFRVVGKKYGAFVFLADFLKGAAPAWAILALYRESPDVSLLALGAGIAAILGHIFNPFLGFKGGKGVATGSGALFGSYPVLFLLAAGVWILAFFACRIVSVSSLLALGSLVFFGFWLVPDTRTGLVFLALFLLITWSHRSNLARLLKGKELKIDKNN